MKITRTGKFFLASTFLVGILAFFFTTSILDVHLYDDNILIAVMLLYFISCGLFWVPVTVVIVHKKYSKVPKEKIVVKELPPKEVVVEKPVVAFTDRYSALTPK